jgi:hypothetical protein
MAEKKSKQVEIKTKQTYASVDEYINTIKNEQIRNDSNTIIKLMSEASQAEPKMWGASLIGFGNILFKSPKTGRTVDWFVMGFSPLKAKLSLHLGIDIQQHSDALQKLGKYKTGVGCLYINTLSDVNLEVLKEIITAAAKK